MRLASFILLPVIMLSPLVLRSMQEVELDARTVEPDMGCLAIVNRHFDDVIYDAIKGQHISVESMGILSLIAGAREAVGKAEDLLYDLDKGRNKPFGFSVPDFHKQLSSREFVTSIVSREFAIRALDGISDGRICYSVAFNLDEIYGSNRFPMYPTGVFEQYALDRFPGLATARKDEANSEETCDV